MYLRAGKTKKFSVFHVENGKIQAMLWFYVCFNVEIRVIWVKNKLFLRFMYVFYEITRFLGKKRLILSKLQMIYANYLVLCAGLIVQDKIELVLCAMYGLSGANGTVNNKSNNE